MFTGIISSVGRVVAITPGADVSKVEIEAPAFEDEPEIGASICCAGICLTVTSHRRDRETSRFTVDVGPETLEVTTAVSWRTGTRLNLERSLHVGDELGGHWVTGHVDGQAIITDRQVMGDTVIFGFDAPEELRRFIAAKGSVALDGTSLTVNHVDAASFDCHLIPHTLSVTTWGDRRTGDLVNLEVDLMARYAARLLSQP